MYIAMEDILLIISFVIRACKLLWNNNLKQLAIATEESFILAKEGKKEVISIFVPSDP
jgi:hypothetical protein